MPPDSRNPRSYEDIVRQTVVDPDTSVRPTTDQEHAAREGFRALDPDEARLQERVRQALAVSPALAGVTVEVMRDQVTLRGAVRTPAALRTMEDILAGLPEIGTIRDEVVIG